VQELNVDDILHRVRRDHLGGHQNTNDKRLTYQNCKMQMKTFLNRKEKSAKKSVFTD